jgi:hypothetical protein
MNCLVLKSECANKLFAKIRSFVRKLHKGELEFNSVHYMGFFGDKGAYQFYDTKFKSKVIHESEIAVSIGYIGYRYCVTITIDNMIGYKEYSVCDIK